MSSKGLSVFGGRNFRTPTRQLGHATFSVVTGRSAFSKIGFTIVGLPEIKQTDLTDSNEFTCLLPNAMRTKALCDIFARNKNCVVTETYSTRRYCLTLEVLIKGNESKRELFDIHSRGQLVQELKEKLKLYPEEEISVQLTEVGVFMIAENEFNKIKNDAKVKMKNLLDLDNPGGVRFSTSPILNDPRRKETKKIPLKGFKNTRLSYDALHDAFQVGMEGSENKVSCSDCSIDIPNGALTEDKVFFASLQYSKEEESSDFLVLTPLLHCVPSTSFERSVTISLPTCYEFEDNTQQFDVIPQTNDGSGWKNLQPASIKDTGMVTFEAQSFSCMRVIWPFSIIIEKIGKKLEFICYKNCNANNNLVLVYEIGDDINGLSNRIEEGQMFKETCKIKSKDDIILEFNHPGVSIEPRVDTITSSEIFYPGALITKNILITSVGEVTETFCQFAMKCAETDKVLHKTQFPLPTFPTSEEISRRQSSISRMNSRNESVSSIGGHQVMISYNWQDSKALAEKICERLKAESIRVWIDEEQMMGELFEKMAEAVNGADVILMFVSRHYETSANCKREAKYAADLKKIIIPVHVQPDYSPPESSWLGLVNAGKIYYHFGKGEFDETFRKLLRDIRNYLSGTRDISEDDLKKLEDLQRNHNKHKLMQLWLKLYKQHNHDIPKSAAKHFPLFLDLSQTMWNDEEISALCCVLKNVELEIEKIDLASCGLTMESFREICSTISKMTGSIKELDISFSSFKGNVVATMCDGGFLSKVTGLLSMMSCFDGQRRGPCASEEEKARLHQAVVDHSPDLVICFE